MDMECHAPAPLPIGGSQAMNSLEGCPAVPVGISSVSTPLETGRPSSWVAQVTGAWCSPMTKFIAERLPDEDV